MRLHKKTALVTGAGSGIGRAIAVLFAREGAVISVIDIDSSGGRETVEMIEQTGGVADFINADVTKASDIERAIRTTVDTHKKLDILINNAGIVQKSIPLEEMDEELWDKIISINLKSIFLGCRYAIPVMKKAGGGVIINTASIAGTRPRVNRSGYSTSKGGAIALTKSLALELAPHNIRVNCISPVGTDTPMLKDFIGEIDAEEKMKATIATIPLGRIGKPEDSAYAVLYLVSDEALFITGVNLEVDGGWGI